MALSKRARRTTVGAFLIAAVAAAAPALGAPNKGFTVDVDNVAAPDADSVRGLAATFAVKLNAPAKQELGAARVTAPAGFVITAASAAAPATSSYSGNVAIFNDLEIPSGGSETVRVTAQVPCGGVASTWNVDAKQSNQYNGDPGNDLQLNASGSDLATALTGVCKPCPLTGCEQPGSSGNSKLTIKGASGAAGDNLVLAFGTELDIDCSLLGHDAVMNETALFDVGTRAKTASLVVAKADLPTGGYEALELCFGSPKPFEGQDLRLESSYDWNGDGVVALTEKLYVGLLPDCADAADLTCVSLRDRGPRNSGIIEARLPAGDPGMRG